MSGTSLDGLDIACCTLKHCAGEWTYKIEKATTLKYDNRWRNKLSSAHTLPALGLMELHREYGCYLGRCANDFVTSRKIKGIDIVASHGHTVFHQPERYVSFQLGNGAAISAACGITVVSDFRSLDIMLGGQGAPLIPVCDELLFPEYEFCLNLGGFANISYRSDAGERLAYDICPVNIALNHFANLLNMDFDKDGLTAASAKADKKLLARLNALKYYRNAAPKSLSREWFGAEFLPLVNKSGITVPEKLATVTEHIAEQVSRALTGAKGARCLVTGGGAFNRYLINKISAITDTQIVIPADDLVNFKEALGFALLGALRIRGEKNCLKSVTGACRDSSGGVICMAG